MSSHRPSKCGDGYATKRRSVTLSAVVVVMANMSACSVTHSTDCRPISRTCLRYTGTRTPTQTTLKTFLFCNSFPPYSFLFFFRTDSTDSPDCLVFTDRLLLIIPAFLLLNCSVFSFFSCWFRAVDTADSCQLLIAR